MQPTFTQELLSQDNMEPDQPGPLSDLTMAQNVPKTIRTKRPAKKTRLLLDARTELTDEELKVILGLFPSDNYSRCYRPLESSTFRDRDSSKKRLK